MTYGVLQIVHRCVPESTRHLLGVEEELVKVSDGLTLNPSLRRASNAVRAQVSRVWLVR